MVTLGTIGSDLRNFANASVSGSGKLAKTFWESKTAQADTAVKLGTDVLKLNYETKGGMLKNLVA